MTTPGNLHHCFYVSTQWTKVPTKRKETSAYCYAKDCEFPSPKVLLRLFFTNVRLDTQNLEEVDSFLTSPAQNGSKEVPCVIIDPLKPVSIQGSYQIGDKPPKLCPQTIYFEDWVNCSSSARLLTITLIYNETTLDLKCLKPGAIKGRSSMRKMPASRADFNSCQIL